MNFRSRLWLSAYFAVVAIANTLLAVIPTFWARGAILRLCGWRLGRRVAIHRGVRVTSLRRGSQIGARSVINHGVLLDNRRGLNIGKNVSIAHDCSLYTLGHDIDAPGFDTKGGCINIGDHAVLFAKVAVMPGVSLGRGSVCYPCAVVVRDVGPFEVVGGNPAQVLRKRSTDLGYELDYRVWLGI